MDRWCGWLCLPPCWIVAGLDGRWMRPEWRAGRPLGARLLWSRGSWCRGRGMRMSWRAELSPDKCSVWGPRRIKWSRVLGRLRFYPGDWVLPDLGLVSCTPPAGGIAGIPGSSAPGCLVERPAAGAAGGDGGIAPAAGAGAARLGGPGAPAGPASWAFCAKASHGAPERCSCPCAGCGSPCLPPWRRSWPWAAGRGKQG